MSNSVKFNCWIITDYNSEILLISHQHQEEVYQKQQTSIEVTQCVYLGTHL